MVESDDDAGDSRHRLFHDDDNEHHATIGLEMMDKKKQKKKKDPLAPQDRRRIENKQQVYTALDDIRQPSSCSLCEDDYEYDKDDERCSSLSSTCTGSGISIEMVERSSMKSKKNHHGLASDFTKSGSSNRTDSPSSSSSSPSSFSLGCAQLSAMVRKNILQRCRSPLPSLLEIFIPVLIVLVLVHQYNEENVHNHKGQVYHSFQLPMDGPWIDLSIAALQNMHDTKKNESSNNHSVVVGDSGNHHHRELLLLSELDDYYDILPDDAPAWLQDLFQQDLLDHQQSVFSHSLFSSHPRRRRHLQDSSSSQKEEDEEEAEDLEQGLGTFNMKNKNKEKKSNILYASSLAAKLMLKNPLPIPSLAQFIHASEILSSSLSVEELPKLMQRSRFLGMWGNLLTLGTVHLSPSDSPVVHQFEKYMEKATNSSVTTPHALKVQLHVDEATAVRHIEERSDSTNERMWALIDFSHWPEHAPNENDTDSDDDNSLHVKYKIRMNQTTLPNTDEIVNYVSVGMNKGYQKYYLSGYLTLQQTLNDFAFEYFNTSSSTSSNTTTGTCMSKEDRNNVWSMPMPTAHYKQNKFFLLVGKLLGFAMAMGFMVPVSLLIKSLVEEKESRMRETLYILGVQPWAHWTSWLISAVIPFFVIALLVTSILATYILKFSNVLLLFSLIGLFLFSTIGFCFCVAAIFDQAKQSAIVGPMAFFATVFPRFVFFGSSQYSNAAEKKWASLLPATAFAFGCDIVADYEYSEQGVQTWNSSQGDYSFDTCLAMLVVDSFLFFFLAWYLDQVMPREYGTPQPIWFLLLPSYWCGSVSSNASTSKNQIPSYRNDMDESLCEDDDHECMADPSLVPQIKVRNLTKRYGGAKNKDIAPAVDQLDLDLYESQITTLLGHNGAGKTTAISLLTGLFAPTSGDASIYGHSIVRNTAQARRSIGICPQQNVLFGGLTVLEHICFFNRIKGIHVTNAKAKALAQEIGLSNFLYTTAAALSGGNKRKLCVAVALCGDPKFLIMDEPTSGMDPCARRSVWEVLRRKRLGRTILLSTHFMDEAELLSDRIAVLRTGNLLCSGTPLFLKNRNGLGYNFTAVMETLSSSSSSPALSAPLNSASLTDTVVRDASYESPANNLLSFIRRYIPEAKIGRIGGKEVSIRLPPGYEDIFPACFDDLENQREKLQIGAFGIQNASLEEVFIRLAQDENDKNGKGFKDTFSAGDVTSKASKQGDGGTRSSGNKYLSPVQQIFLLYKKRVTVQKRDAGGLFVLLAVPVCVIALSLLVLTANISSPGQSIDLSLNLYQSPSSEGVASMDVLVGGGNSTRYNMSEAAATVAPLYKQLIHSAEKQYPYVRFDRVPTNLSSADVSMYLYHSINTNDHSTRYGAFVFNDTVEMKVSINWTQLFDDLDALATDPKSNDQTPWTIRIPLGEMTSLDFSALWKPTSKNNKGSASVPIDTKPDSSAADLGVEPTSPNNLSTSLRVPGKMPDVAIDPVKKPESISSRGSDDEPDLVVDSNQKAASKNPDDAMNQTNKANSSEVPSKNVDDGVDPGPNLRLLAKNKSRLVDLLDTNKRKKKSNPAGTMDPGLLLGLLNNENNKKKQASPTVDPGLLSGLLGGQSNTGKDPFPLSTALLGGDTSSLLDPRDILNENTMIALTFYPTKSVVNIMPELDLPPLYAMLLGGRSFSKNMTLNTLRKMVPEKKESYIRYMQAKMSILHNTSSPHAVAAFNQAYSEFLFKQCTRKRSVRLISENHPLPLSAQQTTEIKVKLSIVAILFALVPLCFIPGGFVAFLVKEKSCKSKHLQLVSGVNLTSYWIATYLYDITLYLGFTVMVMAVFLLYGKNTAQVFVGDAESVMCTLALIFGYGISVLPYSYLLARQFDNHRQAQIAVSAFNFLTGWLPYSQTFVESGYDGLVQSLQPLFRCWPPFLAGEGLAMMTKAFWERGMLQSNITLFDWDYAGRPLFLLYSLAIPYFGLVLIFECSQDGGAGGFLGHLLRSAGDSWERFLLRLHGVKKVNGILMLDDGLVDDKAILDDDVLDEERRVEEHSHTFKRSAPIMYQNLWKVYPPSVGVVGSMIASVHQYLERICYWCPLILRKGGSKTSADFKEQQRAFLPKRAVRGVSTVVEEGETYALLGANGAGKTSTLGVLTGDVSPTIGQVYITGHDATGTEERDGVTMARRHIGFCPQVDPLLDLMSARETLRMYGSLRGIPSDCIGEKIESLLEQLSLTPHADKPSQSLSGGNKRKLSLGIALIGDPKVLLIDESSSGMDPLAKRRIWNLIAEVSKGKTVIATTHSMEEAEALCTRAGIMAKGKLLCLGSVQHLKTKYLDGYTIDVFCQSGKTKEDIDSVVNKMLENVLPGCRLSERYGRFLRFNVPSLSSLGLGTTFRHLQALKTSPLLCVENYSISQCSLEQVFVKLVEQVTNGSHTHNQVAASGSHEIESDIDDEEAPFLTSNTSSF